LNRPIRHILLLSHYIYYPALPSLSTNRSVFLSRQPMDSRLRPLVLTAENAVIMAQLPRLYALPLLDSTKPSPTRRCYWLDRSCVATYMTRWNSYLDLRSVSLKYQGLSPITWSATFKEWSAGPWYF
jgi:hypothetical protein